MAFGGLIGKETQVDLSQYVTETELNSKGFATQSWVEDKINSVVTDEGFSVLNNNWYYRKLFIENRDIAPLSISLPEGNVTKYFAYYNGNVFYNSYYLLSYYDGISSDYGNKANTLAAYQQGNEFLVNYSSSCPLTISIQSNPSMVVFTNTQPTQWYVGLGIDFFVKIVS